MDVVKEDMQRFDVTEEDVFVIKSPGQASWKVQKDTAFSLAHNSICPEIANTDTQSLTYTVVKTKDVHSLNSLYLPNSFFSFIAPLKPSITPTLLGLEQLHPSKCIQTQDFTVLSLVSKTASTDTLS